MPLKLETKKLLSARSERVKSVDFHPTEPWVLAALYTGTVMIWDFNTQALVRQMEVSNLPLRCAKFVLRRQWIVVACDDMTVKILNYNTLEKIKALEGHSDYIRYVAVHPSLPLLLTSSDDMTIKLWDWEKNWQCVATYEGHSHYVMMVQWNPKDNSSFASASLDRTIKIWGVSGGTSAHFTLTGHQRGVNCLDYASVGEKPYLVSGSDDKTVRVWDYQTKQCVHVLEGHTANVSCVVMHPTLPLILSGSEDGVCKLWHSTTYRQESSLNYMLDRLWSIAVMKGSNAVALGYDEGTVVVKLGSDEPVVSFCGGKLIWAKGVDIQTVNLKQLDEQALADTADGEALASLPTKDMGACELFPQSIAHHPSGRLFAVSGDGEYVIYTAQALRNKSFGQAVGFAWSPEGHYATRDASGKISVFHNFKEAFSFKADFSVDDIHSGELLCVRGPEYVVFYDWTEYRVVRRIDVAAVDVFWSETGKFCAITASDSMYLLAFDRAAVVAAAAGGAHPEDGIEIAFELHNEVQERVRSGVWIGDSCFVFVNDRLKLNTLVGGQVEVAAHLDHNVKVLGFLPEHGRVYCCDKALNVVTFALDLNLVKYKAAVAVNDLATAESLFPSIPEKLHTKVARFLESQGYRAEALEITKDEDHKFELALAVGKLALARQFVGAGVDAASLAKLKQLGDRAIETGDLGLAESCFRTAKDAGSLLLIASCTGDEKLLTETAEIARDSKQLNVELMARTLLGDVHGCVDALVSAGMIAEAALYARSHCPDALAAVYPLWKAEIRKINPQLSNAFADPEENSELFPELLSAPNRGIDHSKPSVAVKPPLVHAPVIQAPVVQAPVVQAPVVHAPVTQAGAIPVRALDDSPMFKSPTSSPRETTAPVRNVSPAAVPSQRLPTPPTMPPRPSGLAGPPAGLAGPPSGPPTALRGPPPMPSRISRPPETQIAPPTPESQLPPPRAPEATNEDVDLL